ncbi:MAG: hypothetical protein ACTH58_08265 [Marinomonas foliarum]|uniref:hypothetical protein n=1 Tax=Marinomonas foliarum TaxID=491950 RepID=UPI003F968ABE
MNTSQDQGANYTPKKGEKKKIPTSISHYQETAYSSEDFAPQKPRVEQGFLRRMMTKGKVFGFSHTTDAIAISAIDDVTPEDMAEYETDYETDGKPMYWDEKTLSSESFSGWSQVYMVVASLAKVCLIVFLPLFYSILFLLMIFDDIGWSDGYSEDFLILTLYGTLPCLLISGHFKLVDSGHYYLAPFLQSKRVFEMNRTTGMVTLFKRNKPYFTHPFIEFDCVLLSSPTRQGFLNYSLTLIHRYSNYSVGVPLGSLLGPNAMVDEYLRFWNMAQRYMDISQPLPDIMMLEPARQRDPTTIEYDKEHNRNPRYWRDMTEEEYAQKLKMLKTEQKSIPATGKPIDIFKGPDSTASKKHNRNKKK